MTEQFAEINGIKICYEVLGKDDGYPVFLIHGFGAKKETWIAQVGELSKHFKVVRFDNRGAGKSDRPDGPYTMEIFADDINSLMDYLNIGKAHVIGWSLGGMITQNFVLKYPERVNRVVMINTNYGFPDEGGPKVYKEMRLRGLEELKEDPNQAFWNSARTGYHMKFRKEMEANPKKKFYDIWSAEDLIKESTIDPPTIHDIESQAEALNTHSTFDRLDQIKNHTLLITGSHDRLTPRSVMEEMNNKIQNSKLVVIEKAGHNAPLSRALEVNKAIIDFLKGAD